MADVLECVDDLRSIGISCEALVAVGGVNKRIWITQKQQIDSYTLDADGYVNTLVMATDGSSLDYKLQRFVGKKNTHSGTVEGVVGDNVNLVAHNSLLKVFVDTPAKRAALEKYLNADEVVVFFETENGQIEIFGLDKGLEMSALAGSTGVLLQDDTGYLLTLSGQQRTLPNLMLVSGSLASTVAYLDALSETL